MTKGFHKKISKRVTCKRRYKIEKNVRQHHKKMAKLAKKNGTKKPKPKDPGVPASLPFKEEVLREAQEAVQREQERKELVREEFKRRQGNDRSKKLDVFRGIDTSQTPADLTSLVKDAEKRSKAFVAKDNNAGKNSSLHGVSNLSSYYKEFQKVVDSADIIIEVVDARDPLGTRCPEVENAVAAAGTDKRLVILLNKVDLIPRDNLVKWLAYLRNEFPTVAFKASTQSQKANLGRSNKDILTSKEDLLQSSKCLGAQTLMKLLGNYCRNQGIKNAIKVGVVGFPNVGKSSVINSLKRSRACSVGSTPGLTKTLQEVSLDKHIKLIDSPGIVFAKTNQFGDLGAGSADRGRLITSLIALRNATKVETLEDPVTPVEALLSRVKKEDLMLFYRLPDFSSSDEFLEILARRFGKLKKGGVADTFTAARKVLCDWNSGKIKYYTIPPESHRMPTHIDASIVTKLSAGFHFDSELAEEEMQELDNGIPNKVVDSLAICIPSLGFLSADTGDHLAVDMAEKDAACNDSDSESEHMAVDGVKSILGESTRIQLRPRKSKLVAASSKNTDSVMLGMQLNREKRVHFKKQQKLKKRQIKASEKLASNLDKGMDLNAYDFETDFK